MDKRENMNQLVFILIICAVLLYSWFNYGWWNLILIPAEIILFAVVAIIVDGYKSAKADNASPRRKRDKEQPIKVNCALRITYEDTKGNVTERDIQILSYKPNSQHIQARDSIAKASRTFRLDRIQQAIDKQTGELLDNDQLHSWILERQQ